MKLGINKKTTSEEERSYAYKDEKNFSSPLAEKLQGLKLEKSEQPADEKAAEERAVSRSAEEKGEIKAKSLGAASAEEFERKQKKSSKRVGSRKSRSERREDKAEEQEQKSVKEEESSKRKKGKAKEGFTGDKIAPENEEAKTSKAEKPLIVLGRVTPLAKRAIEKVEEELRRDKNLKSKDLARVLNKGTTGWDNLSDKEKKCVEKVFERKKKEMEKGKPKKEAADYEKFQEESGEGKSSEPQDQEKEKLLKRLKAAAEVGDEEEVARIQEELKTGEEMFEEAQALEAERKAREKAEKEIRLIGDEKLREKKADIEPYGEKDKAQKEWAEKGHRETEWIVDSIVYDLVGEEKREEAEAKLEKLKQGLEESRKKYVEIDYQKKKAYKRLANFFGKILASGRETDEEVAYYRAVYENKLFEYKNALIKQAKEASAGPEELGNIVKIFAAEADLELPSAQDQVKIENHEGRFWGWAKKHSKSIIKNYRRIPLRTKILIAAALGLAGFQAAIAGGAAAVALGGAAGVRRIFASAVMGVSVSMWLEARNQKKREKSVEKEKISFLEQLKNVSDDDKYEFASRWIDGLNQESDKKLRKFKNKQLFQLASGILAGSVVGSGALSEILGGAARGVSEFFGREPEVPSPIEKISPGAGEEPPPGAAENLEEWKGPDTGEEIIEKAEDFAGAENYTVEQLKEKTFSIRQELTQNLNEWEQHKNMTYDEANKAMPDRLQEKLHNLGVRYAERFSVQANSLEGETLENWTKRLAKLVLEKKYVHYY